MLDDTYNANPASVRAALVVARQLADLRQAELHLVLGEMRELGSWSELEHSGLRTAIAAVKPRSVTAVAGDAQRLLGGGYTAEFYETAQDAVQPLMSKITPGSVVLVKASRGVRAELMVDALVHRRGTRG